MPRRLLSVIATILSAGITVTTAADTVTKTNGQTLNGTVVGESDKEITLQTSVGELVVRQKIARDQIKSIQKDAVAKNRYCLIPIHGEIGPDVKADWLAKALEQAQGFKPTVIVFDINSPGGSVEEMAKIMELVSKAGVPTIAYCHETMSAAAMIAISCGTIVVDAHSTIGAAVPWRIGPDGTPRDVEAKFVSAYRAMCKTAAETARHNPLIVQGMMDTEIVLSIVRDDDGTQRVVEGTPRAAVPLKKKGQILCLSAGEALSSGLAAGAVQDVKGIQRVLNVADWAPCGESVWAYMESRPAAAKANQDRTRQEQFADAQKEKLTEAVAKINKRIEELKKTKEEAAKRVAAIPDEYHGELNRVDPRLPIAQQDAKNQEIRKRYETAYVEARNKLSQADAELQDLQRLKTEAESRLKDAS